jgi:hypothetical protein
VDVATSDSSVRNVCDCLQCGYPMEAHYDCLLWGLSITSPEERRGFRGSCEFYDLSDEVGSCHLPFFTKLIPYIVPSDATLLNDADAMITHLSSSATREPIE